MLALGLALPWVVVIAASLVAAVIDLRTRRIPNALSGPLLLSGIAWAVLTALGAFGPIAGAAVTKGVGDSILGALVASLPFVILWLAMGSGAGDAKLMMAIGAWLGLAGGLLVLVCTALAGGVFALAWALTEGRLLATLANLPRSAVDLVYIVRGPGRVEDRRHVVLAASAASAAAGAEPSAATFAARKSRHKLPYAPAIFAGTCAAALRVFLS
jgi:prepilin peptidase CpaA